MPSPSPPGPKFRRRAEARPDEVLDAAMALFIENGFAATRVDDIARRAGLSKGALYLYFPSKEAVLEALVRRAIVPIADSALDALRHYEGDPRVAIAMVIRMVGQRLADPRVVAVPKVVFRELPGFPHLAEMYRVEVLDKVIPVLAGLIRKGTEQGYLRQVDPELTVRSVVGPLLMHLVMAEIFGITPAGGLQFDRLVDNHLSILFDGLGVPPGQPAASKA